LTDALRELAACRLAVTTGFLKGVGSIRIFETFTDAFFGHLFFAEAEVSCTRSRTSRAAWPHARIRTW
jgi:hypothetical protein